MGMVSCGGFMAACMMIYIGYVLGISCSWSTLSAEEFQSDHEGCQMSVIVDVHVW